MLKNFYFCYLRIGENVIKKFLNIKIKFNLCLTLLENFFFGLRFHHLKMLCFINFFIKFRITELDPKLYGFDTDLLNSTFKKAHYENITAQTLMERLEE